MISNLRFIIPWTGTAIALAACGSAEQPADDPVEFSAETNILTEAYLTGDWCYEGYETGESIEEARITYRFAEDGTLLYQSESNAPVDQPGTFELDREGLVISPAFSAFPPMRASSIDRDRLTLLSLGSELTWTRGACG